MHTKNASIEKPNNNFLQYIKGTIVALIISFACVIVFALTIKYFSLADGWIVPINLLIKAISVLVGTIIFTKSKEGGLIKGLIFGASYTTISFLLFSALSVSFDLSLSLLLDYMFAIAIGSIVGILRVNLSK